MSIALTLPASQEFDGIRLGPIVPIDVGQGVSYGFSLWSSPANPNILIACGLLEHGESDIGYGYVYTSKDAGKTWRRTLTENSSVWVSEESCALGPRRAYFAAGSAPISPQTGLERGHLHVYTSLDSGGTWRLSYVRPEGWLDWTFFAPPNQPRSPVVLFGNSVTDRLGHWSSKPRPYVVVSDEAASNFSQPISLSGTPHKYFGIFASGAVTLNDGTSLITSGAAYIGAKKTTMNIVGVFSFTPHLRVLRLRAVLDNMGGNASAAHVVIAKQARAHHRERLYAIWIVSSLYSSSLRLAISDDGGFTWKKRTILTGQGYGNYSCPTTNLLNSPSVAATEESVAIGFLQAGRVSVAFSSDSTQSLTRPMVIGTYSQVLPQEKLDWSVNFAEDFMNEELCVMSSRSKCKYPNFNAAGLSVRLTRNPGYHNLSLASDGARRYGALWTAYGMDHSVWSRAIEVPQHLKAATGSLRPGLGISNSCTPRPLPTLHPQARLTKIMAPAGARDVTAQINIDYPIISSYDAERHIVSANVAVVNKGRLLLNGRLLLVALAPISDYGSPIAVAPSGSISGAPYWELQDRRIKPGSRSRSIELKFRIEDFHHMPVEGTGDGISTPLRLYLIPMR